MSAILAVSATMEGRVIEYVDHLHEHFEDPVRIRGGRYLAPSKPGYSIARKNGSAGKVPVAICCARAMFSAPSSTGKRPEGEAR